jgi:hypothetical protein
MYHLPSVTRDALEPLWSRWLDRLRSHGVLSVGLVVAASDPRWSWSLGFGLRRADPMPEAPAWGGEGPLPFPTLICFSDQQSDRCRFGRLIQLFRLAVHDAGIRILLGQVNHIS